MDHGGAGYPRQGARNPEAWRPARSLLHAAVLGRWPTDRGKARLGIGGLDPEARTGAAREAARGASYWEGCRNASGEAPPRTGSRDAGAGGRRAAATA